MMGMPTSQDAFMTVQERIDFSIVLFVFSVLYAGLESYFSCPDCQFLFPMSAFLHRANTFTIVTAQIMVNCFLREFPLSHAVYFSNHMVIAQPSVVFLELFCFCQGLSQRL